jgi:hypothetical protein
MSKAELYWKPGEMSEISIESSRTLNHMPSFLVQSFLPAQKGSSGTPRANSPANKDAERRISEDEGVDMKEVDGLLGEVAVMRTVVPL